MDKFEKYITEAYGTDRWRDAISSEKKNEFTEGDKVTINYGEYKGKTGTFMEYSLSYMFALVKTSGKVISVNVSDLRSK